jgi:hypothetical protein
MAEVDADVVGATLAPYRTHARYLQGVSVGAHRSSVFAVGAFSIGESCYIDDTGHFNAAELIMCANQLGYVCIGEALRRRLIDLDGFDLAWFQAKQLSSVLILKADTSFRKMINPRSFIGWCEWHSMHAKRGLLMSVQAFKFMDDTGGLAMGEYLLAFRP